MPKILIVVNEDRFLLSHRLPVALAAVADGYCVKAVCKDTGSAGEIASYGIETLDLVEDPTGMNPLNDLRTMFYLYRLFKKEKPDIVHLVGMKNILWGSLAAKFARVPGVVEAISGLGSLFNGDQLSKVAKGVLRVIRFSNSRKGVKAIFQNRDDLKIFTDKKAVKENQICMIKGSGVDLREFCHYPESDTLPLKIIFTARMVKEKGVLDIIEAAERLKPEYGDKLQFWLCGRTADNSSAVPENYLKEHCDGEYIQWLGLRDDIKDLLRQSHIMVFPSYYREGLPKSLIEASAVGRPIITCDSVGCKDVVDDGVNGFLVMPKDVDALVDKIKLLVEDKDLRERMGNASRKKAEKEFSIQNVIDKHLDIYRSLLQ